MIKDKVKFIDLFAGIGGIRLGYEKAGAVCVFTSEWDKFSQKTYEANHGEKTFGDINKVDSKDIPDFNILLAGFPCQPFSIAGRKHGFEDEKQGNLFFEIARILKDKKPNGFMLENVKNIITHDKGNTLGTIQKILNDLRYTFDYKIIDAAKLVPQHRERTYMVGFRKELVGDNFVFEFPEIEDKKPKLKDILDKKVDSKYTLSDKLWDYLQKHAQKHKGLGNGFGFGIPPHDGISRTLTARYYKDGSEILIEQPNKNPRRLTPRECARLMGFPEDFVIPVSDTQAYKQFGNSVVVPVIEKIAKQVVKRIKLSWKFSG